MKKSLAAAALALGMLAMSAAPAAAGPSAMGSKASCMAPAGVLVRSETGRGVGQHLQFVLDAGHISYPGAPFHGMTFGEFITSGWLSALYCTE